MLLKLPGLNLPERSSYIAWTQLVELTGITPTQMAELTELGWIEPGRTASEEYIFTHRDVYRIQKLIRICKDLDVTYTGGSIIVDLLERIEELENEIEDLNRLA
jgi:chaperone modulatory protein CbpM